MAETKKREKNFERSYSDKSGEVEILHNDEPVIAVSINGKPATEAEGDNPATEAVKGVSADVLLRAGMRYITDILVGVGNAVLKAEGGTIDKATAKMAETLSALQDGTFKFRAASGQGGLSVEEEQAIIAGILVTLGKAKDAEDGAAKVAAVYARTKKNAKGYIVRPDYNALKNVPQIKAELAKAAKSDDSAIDDVLGKLTA